MLPIKKKFIYSLNFSIVKRTPQTTSIAVQSQFLKDYLQLFMGKLLVHPCDHWGLTCENETFDNDPSLKMYKVSICNYVYTIHVSLFANGTRLYCFISDFKSIHNFTNMMLLTTDVRNFSYASWRIIFDVKNLVIQHALRYVTLWRMGYWLLLSRVDFSDSRSFDKLSSAPPGARALLPLDASWLVEVCRKIWNWRDIYIVWRTMYSNLWLSRRFARYTL